MLIHEAVAAAARRRPETTALVDADGRTTSYAELLTGVTDLAGRIGRATRPGDRVAVVSRKASGTVLAMLAALTAGRSYVPVDPAMPRTRRDFILRQTGCAMVLDPSGHADAAPGRGQAPQPVLDDEAYVLYTSGSTGEPKGVVITHDNALAFVRWAASAFPLRHGDQVAVHAPLHFDLPVYDVYVGLAGGATLHLIDERTALFPQALHRFLADRAISHLYAVPSALSALLNRSTLGTDGLPALRRLLYAGEEFRPAALARWMAAVPGATVANLYGPIETNVVTHWTLPRPPAPDRRIPLGAPVTGATIALLGADGTASERLPMDGEILVAGDCVTPGYLGRPDLTERATTSLATESGVRRYYRTGDIGSRDPDGTLHLLGRRDGLVKTRGYRVELGEIEAAIGSHPAIDEVAVLALPDPEVTHRLHAVVVPLATAEQDRLAERLVTHCRERLPGYMVPGRIHLVPTVPHTSTGKVARAQLAELVTSRTGGTR